MSLDILLIEKSFWYN